jgi:hypothetical protein
VSKGILSGTKSRGLAFDIPSNVPPLRIDVWQLKVRKRASRFRANACLKLLYSGPAER